jgi:putative ABC transport system permease protein
MSSPSSSAVAARPPSLWSLAWRQLRRDLRAGELRLLVVAVMLAVAALTAVGFFADRLENGLKRDARQMLGGDAIVAADSPLPPVFAQRAAELGLAAGTMTTFPSMGRASDDKGGAARLVSVKAVGGAYPLRGKLVVKQRPDGVPETLARGPEPGSVWVDVNVLDSLQLVVGDTLLLGDASLRITRILAIEPDRGGGFMTFAPRVMLNEADLAATALIQPASRATYRFAVAAPDGREADVRAFSAFAQERITADALRGARLESLESGRPEMRQTLDRAEKFLNLVALLAALLAAVAVGIASRDFAQRHLDDCAMQRVLGLAQRRLAGLYAIEFVVVGVVAGIAGVLLGWLVHNVFVWLLSGLLNATLPPPRIWPALFGMGVAMALLAGFGLPPVLQLARVPPLRVIRRDVGTIKAASLGVLLAGVAGFVALLLAVSSDFQLGLLTVGGFAAALALFAGAAWIAVQVLRQAVPRASQPRWWTFGATAPRWLVLATRQIAARPAFAVLQVSALSVGLMALVLLVLLRTDLVRSWRQATPPDAPNRFVINLQPDQSDAFQAALVKAGVKRYDWFPMIRGRLVAVNGRDVAPTDYPDERAQRLVEREFNLSHAAQLPDHNTIVAGRWTPEEAGGLSVEDGLAQSLGTKLGDTLRFDIGGQIREGRVTSLRKVDWGSMRANFFVMFTTSQLPDLPATQLAAFRAPATPGFDSGLSRQFPNITNVDISASIAEVQRILDQVIRAVEFLFGFTLAAGLVVLFAAVSATREARAREYAVMRAMGAGSTLLQRVQRAELLGVGALAGLLASAAAMAVGWALAHYAFQFEWQPSPLVPLAGSAAGALLALAAGWWGLREVLRRPVVDTLRRAAE